MSRCFLDNSVGEGVFVIGLSQISSSFLSTKTLATGNENSNSALQQPFSCWLF